jgi:hypothetical protein
MKESHPAAFRSSHLQHPTSGGTTARGTEKLKVRQNKEKFYYLEY